MLFRENPDKAGRYLWFIMIQSHYLNTHNDCGWEPYTFPLVSVYGFVTMNFSDLFWPCPAICGHSLLGQ